VQPSPEAFTTAQGKITTQKLRTLFVFFFFVLNQVLAAKASSAASEVSSVNSTNSGHLKLGN